MKSMNHCELDKHESEVQVRWGQTEAYAEHKEKTKDYTKQTWNDLAEGMDQIMAEFAACIKSGEKPDSINAQNQVKTLQDYISKHYYQCTAAILVDLGQMYVADERFKHTIDKHADGTAAFIHEAITAYCSK